MKADLLELGAADAARAIASGQLDRFELLDVYAAWVSKSAATTGAFLAIDFDFARDQMKAMHPGPLAGVPMAMKDLLHIRGLPTTCASKILAGYRPAFDATATQRLAQAGTVFYGKLNLDEFAMGSSNENSAYAPVHNPWDLARTPGGSSGGSAAAVSARQTPGTLGSDTGGSIRQPAAFCGITGIKPTYGRVSRYGLVAFASSLDQIGPMARSAEDCALMLETIAGIDARDATTADEPVPAYTQAKVDFRGLRVGLPKEYFGEGLDESVRRAVTDVETWLRQSGATVKPISLPHTSYTIATYYLITSAEASSNLGRYDGLRFGARAIADDLESTYNKTRGQGFGPEVKRRIMLGTFALSSGYYEAYYVKAQRVRTLIRRDFEQAFAEVDTILTPTTPTTAFKLGEKISDPLQMYLNDIFTGAANLAGVPAISFPCGFDQNGLPIGAQLIAAPFAEATLLAVTKKWQQDTSHHLKTPPMCQAETAK